MRVGQHVSRDAIVGQAPAIPDLEDGDLSAGGHATIEEKPVADWKCDGDGFAYAGAHDEDVKPRAVEGSQILEPQRLDHVGGASCEVR